MKRTKYKYTFDRLIVNNRWKRPYYSRSSNWVYFGVSTKWFNPTECEISLHFFGIDFRFWFDAKPKTPKLF